MGENFSVQELWREHARGTPSRPRDAHGPGRWLGDRDIHPAGREEGDAELRRAPAVVLPKFGARPSRLDCFDEKGTGTFRSSSGRRVSRLAGAPRTGGQADHHTSTASAKGKAKGRLSAPNSAGKRGDGGWASSSRRQFQTLPVVALKVLSSFVGRDREAVIRFRKRGRGADPSTTQHRGGARTAAQGPASSLPWRWSHRRSRPGCAEASDGPCQ